MIWAYSAIFFRILLTGYERIIVKRLGHESDSLAATFLFFAIASVCLFPFLFFVPLPQSYGFLTWVIISSFIYSMADLLYVKSLSIGEVSLVGPLYNFNIFFILILTAIFLGESLSPLKIVGILLLFYGASFLNKQKNIFKSLVLLSKEKACLLMMVSSFVLAIGRTIDGSQVQGHVHPIIYAFSLNTVISIFLFFYMIAFKKVKTTWHLFKRKTKISLVAGAINAYSYLCALFAYQKMEISVVEPISMLSMIVTVVLAHFLFQEKVKNRLIAVVIMIFGAWLVSL